MKSKLIVAAALAAVFSVSAQAEMDDAQKEAFEKDCKSYAAEEAVPADEMEGYIAQCVQDLAAAEAEGANESSEPSEDSDKE